jgi:LmbE family N-acetylglucosaminyl deacetylase
MHWIYLSPHLDDVVLSVGGLVWEQAQSGETVEIWTLCAGDPPPPPYTAFAEELHARWGVAPRQASAVRRAEDAAACRALGAGLRHSPLPDCVYRRRESGAPVIAERDDLFRPGPLAEAHLVPWIASWIQEALPPGARLVSPLALGGHVDHRLVRAAAERIGLPLGYYADYPYAVADPLDGSDLRRQLGGCRPGLTGGAAPAALAAWQEAVAAYASQISTFWGSLDEMRARIAAYQRESGGATLWIC